LLTARRSFTTYHQTAPSLRGPERSARTTCRCYHATFSYRASTQFPRVLPRCFTGPHHTTSMPFGTAHARTFRYRDWFHFLASPPLYAFYPHLPLLLARHRTRALPPHLCHGLRVPTTGLIWCMSQHLPPTPLTHLTTNGCAYCCLPDTHAFVRYPLASHIPPSPGLSVPCVCLPFSRHPARAGDCWRHTFCYLSGFFGVAFAHYQCDAALHLPYHD